MKLLDRYILKEWLKVFAMALCAMVGLLLVGQVYDSMGEFLQAKAPVSAMVAYYAYQIPALMPIVLPVAILVSMLFVLGNLHKNQEITAMRAAGLSVWRITRTLWAGGVAGTAALIVLNAQFIPQSIEASRTIREEVRFAFDRSIRGAAAASSTGSVFFDNGRERRRWRVGELGAYTDQASRVQVYELDAEGVPLRQTFAEYAKFDPAKGFWIFENGRTINYAPGGGAPSGPMAAFKRKEMPEYTEKPMQMLLMTKKPSGLSLGEINTLLRIAGDLESKKTAALSVRYHRILAWPFACLVVVAIAIPFAVAGVRTNPMVGVSKAIVIFALYYLLDTLGDKLGAQQILPVVVAAWLPNFAAAAFAARLCFRAN